MLQFPKFTFKTNFYTKLHKIHKTKQTKKKFTVHWLTVSRSELYN